MTKYYTPSCPQTRSLNAGQIFNYLLNLFFVVGWWIFFSEIGHTLTIVLTKGCYCDFSLPEAPCYGIYVVITEIILLLLLTVPLFLRFGRGFFIEQVGIGKKLVILLASILLAAAVPYLLLAIEEGFAWVAPQTSLIEFTPWADADIMRIVRNRY